jgi:tryptophan-rich sensory protein
MRLMKDIAFEEQGPMRPLPRLLAVAPVASVAILGSLVTTPNIPGWYASLEKPTGTPPNWLFGPVWTVLYGLMAFAFWRVLGLPRDTPRRSLAIATFSAQLVLNLAWSFVFFGLRSPLAAFVVILLLVAAILACILVLGQIDTASAIALVPYGLWVLYATFLNAGVWWLNG